MGKLLFSSALFIWPICAQYSDLATTRDGNQLYFSSSLRLRGTNELDTPKIFRYTSAFDLIQQPATSNEYLVEPEVSADGAVTGYTDTNPFECSHTFCDTLTPLPESGVILDMKIPHDPLSSLLGRLRLARDGKSAMICCGRVAPRTQPKLVDLITGAVVDLKGFDAIGDGRQAFSEVSNGSPVVLLLHQKDIPVLYQGGKTTRLHFAHSPILARMSADARTIVYEAADPGGLYELIVHHAGTGQEETLQHGPSVPAAINGRATPSYFQPWISDDGLSVLFLAVNKESGLQQAFVESTNGSGLRLLTNSSDVPEGANTATLSGDGSLAYAGTPDGRILRIVVASGRIEELAGRTPQLMALQTVAVGSVSWISGLALSSHQEHPKVMVGNREAPVISAQPTLVKFQIPWEIPVGQPAEIRLEHGSPPPFESVLTVTTAAVNAAFLNPQVSPFEISLFPEGLAFHQDFRSLVLPSDPAQPGETIHFYMSGLGPVTGPLATGQKTPSSGPLHKVIYPPVFCGVPLTGRVQVDARVRFAGLAPGYVGLYQMDLEVPNGLVNADSLLGCGFPTPGEGGYEVVETHLYVRLP
jgi:uncharacterized protein (TIGR03437 family)